MPVPHPHLHAASTLVAFVFALHQASAGSGDVDATFDAHLSGTVMASVAQPDGRMIVGGSNLRIDALNAPPCIRLMVDGAVDGSFAPPFDSAVAGQSVSSIAIDRGGSILIGGNFKLLNSPGPKTWLARIDALGTPDASFTPALDGAVTHIAIQADGRILLAGTFTMIDGLPRAGVARLNVDGSVDASFHPVPESPGSLQVLCTMPLGDGRILIGGEFETIDGVRCRNLARINVDGSVDAMFCPAPGAAVHCMALQADGKVLAGGEFLSLGGVPCGGVVRLGKDGAPDWTFLGAVDRTVTALCVQTNGCLLLGTRFDAGRPTEISKPLLRLLAGGRADISFAATNLTGGNVLALTQLPDGDIFAGGYFVTQGVPRTSIARFHNDAGIDRVMVSGRSSVQWLRPAAAPEVHEVRVELTQDGGTSYSWLGNATRIAGGWSLTGLALPAAGKIRLHAQTSDSGGFGHARPLEAAASIGRVATPEIDVRRGNGNVLPDGGGIDFGTTNPSLQMSESITVANVGLASLTGMTLTLDGADAGEFRIDQQALPDLRGPDAGVRLPVTFAPVTTGTKHAVLHIANNDVDESPYDIALSGTAVLSDDAALASLNAYPLSSPLSFSPGVTSYTLPVPHSQTTIQIWFEPSHPASTIKLNGSPLSSHTTGTLTLPAGDQSFDFKVTAQDGTTERTYHITFERQAPAAGEINPWQPLSFAGTSVCAFCQDGAHTALIGGAFSLMGGETVSNLARINSSGVVDASFAPVVLGQVMCVASQRDRRILVGGQLISVNGIARTAIARLWPDGRLDNDFTPVVAGSGAAPFLYGMGVQDDGSVVVFGSFISINGLARSKLARLNPDGSLDTSFAPSIGGSVSSLAMQADGSMIIGGSLVSVNGVARTRLARLNSDGTLDASYDPVLTTDAGDYVNWLTQQPDGDLLVALFLEPNGTRPRSYLHRFHADGSLDRALPASLQLFTPPRPLLDARGDIIVSDNVTSARLLPDGTADSSFLPGQTFVEMLGLWRDGRILSQRGNLLYWHHNDSAESQLLVPDAHSVRWERGGASPEICRVSFALSVDNGNTFTPLGTAVNSPGVWTLDGLSLPASGQIKASAWIDHDGRSCAYVEEAVAFGRAATGHMQLSQDNIVIADGGTIDFGGTQTHEPRTLFVPLTNTGEAAITNLQASIDGNDASAFVLAGSPPSVLAPGDSCFLEITCTTATAATKMAALHLTSDNAINPALNFVLTTTSDVSHESRLASLALTGGTLAPVFDGNTLAYAVTVTGVQDLSIQPAALSATATVRVEGSVVPPGSSITLSMRELTKTFAIEVTAADGSTRNTYVLSATQKAGVQDAGFTPPLSFTASALAEQPDGFVLVGGSSTISVARLAPSGAIDPAFHIVSANSSVAAIFVQADGKIIIGGNFTSLNQGVPRTRLARLLGDGRIDTTFTPTADGAVLAIADTPDGGLIVAGSFTNINGVPRNGLARLMNDGTLDTAFTPPAATSVTAINCVRVLDDGRVLAGGAFTSTSPSRKNIALFTTTGSIDTSFTPPTTLATANSIAIERGGRVLVGGGSSTPYLRRLNTNGTLDASYSTRSWSGIGGLNSLALQASGDLVTAGTVSGIDGNSSLKGIVRLLTTGALASDFRSDVRWYAQGATILHDGTILLAATNATVNGVTPQRAVSCLANDSATESLSVPDSAHVRWLRSGAAPEPLKVWFELSVDGGETYSMLGKASAISNGWELGGLALPSQGQIRARARVAGGKGNGSCGIVQSVIAFGRAASANLSVTTDAGAVLHNGETLDFTDTAPGLASTRTLSLISTGELPLTGVSASIDGPQALAFSLVPLSASSLASGGASTPCGIVFAPSGTGTATATLHVLSNDPDQPSFDVLLSATSTLSGDANLNSLSARALSLSPAFAPATLAYSASAPSIRDSITITARAASALAAVSINGQSGSNDVFGPFTLTAGANVFAIQVTVQDGTTRAITLTITRGSAPVAGDFDNMFGATANSQVSTLIPVADGKIMAGGAFSTMNGTTHKLLARLAADGTLDMQQPPDLSPLMVLCLAEQADGSILVGGNFNYVGGASRTNIARLTSGSALDTTAWTSSSQFVNAIVPQPDGKVLVATVFNGLTRYFADGSTDSSFAFPGIAITGSGIATVNSVVTQADGKLIICGTFDTVGAESRQNIARINADGTVDTSFSAAIDGTAQCMHVRPDGRILVGGDFSTAGPQGTAGLALLETDGSANTSFSPNCNGSITSIVAQADGRLIVTGAFSQIGGALVTGVARLNADGSADPEFSTNGTGGQPGFGATIVADGSVLVGKSGSSLGGMPASTLGRLKNGTATQSLTVTSQTRVQWLRGGCAPEAAFTLLDVSTDNGLTWTPGTVGTRINGGWEFATHLPPSGIVRARAAVRGGQCNGSSYFANATVSFSGLSSPILGVEQPAAHALERDALIDFGSGTSSKPKTLAITLVNHGNANLTGIHASLSGVDAGSFSIVTAPPASLAPNGKASLTVRFSPSLAARNYTTSLRIDSNDYAGPFDLALTGNVPAPPIITSTPANVFTLTGQPVTWTASADASGGAVTWQWRKNGAAMPGKTNATLTIASIKPTDAGSYSAVATNDYGQAISHEAQLIVLTPLPAISVVKTTGSMMMKSSATLPKSCAIKSVQWARDLADLFDSPPAIKGSTTTALTLSGADAGMSGRYACTFVIGTPDGDAQTRSNTTSLIVADVPAIAAPNLPTVTIGQEVRMQISAANGPTHYTARGLPSGLVLDTATGLITGRPTAAKIVSGSPAAYGVTFTVSNAAGSTTITAPWTILPLPDDLTGTFTGLIERVSPLNAGHGGSIKLTIASTARFTGTVKLGASSTPIAGTIIPATDRTSASGAFKLNRNAPDTPFVITIADRQLAGSIADGISTPCAFRAWRGIWTPTHAPDAGYVGTINSALTPPAAALAPGSALPQGTGYLITTVAASGSLTWTGKLADGTAISGTGTLGPNGQIAHHQMLYSNTGSILGWSRLQATTSEEDGTLGWFKVAQAAGSTTRSYKSGIALHDLTVIGAKYQKPVTGQIVLGLSPSPPDNAHLAFARGGLTASLDQDFQISTKNIVTMPANPQQITCALASATGLISGHFILVDDDPLDLTPPIAKLTRTASYNGLLITRTGYTLGIGHFNLAALPALPGDTIARTPMWSGAVELTPH